jgi:protein-tyrosine phosphatase
MAEAIFQDMVNKVGLGDQISSDSAGTGDWHEGETAHPGTLALLKRNGIAYSGRARVVKASDFRSFNYILAMDRSHLIYLKRFAGESSAEIDLFLSYARKAETVQVEEVPDPYYNGKFDETYELVKKGCVAFLAYLRAENKV